ncbi:hypothetical protein Q3304_17590 [Clostridioides sp. GD02377]|uniref:hypothetical protein n=1 Tax=unclassified Clostridioides TaxID=2635829 RepID=UPI00389ED5C0
MIENLMITENEVVDCVVSYLEKIGFSIESRCNTMEKGIDIVAQKNNRKLLIEAKGATTSKDTSRKGHPFSSNQINNHVSRAVFKALQMKEYEEDAVVAIALPYTKTHVRVTKTVEKTLKSLEILTIWCDGVNVSIDGSSKILEQLK